MTGRLAVAPRLLRLAPLSGAALLLGVAAPGSAQVGINGTRQAASATDVEISLNPLSRCGRSGRRAAALAGAEARAVERERLLMDYRRTRYAGSGLTEEEAALLDERARRLETGVSRAYNPTPYRSEAGRGHSGRGRRSYRGC